MPRTTDNIQTKREIECRNLKTTRILKTNNNSYVETQTQTQSSTKNVDIKYH